VSIEDARQQAEAAVQALVQRYQTVKHLPAAHHYGYADRPLREQILAEYKSPSGERTAVITRNLSGCQVLNATRALFIDIDFPEAPFELFGWFKKFLKPSGPRKLTEADFEAAAIAKAELWARRNPGWGWRAYRTRAGMRLLATHDLFEPASATVESAFEALGADPLYRRLCKAQQSFRARLTPKPWRCGSRPAPVPWPWTNPRDEGDFARWEHDYSRLSERFSTCHLRTIIGSTEVHPDLVPLITVHDERSHTSHALPLA
jgi:hypothetical protein